MIKLLTNHRHGGNGGGGQEEDPRGHGEWPQEILSPVAVAHSLVARRVAHLLHSVAIEDGSRGTSDTAPTASAGSSNVLLKAYVGSGFSVPAGLSAWGET